MTTRKLVAALTIGLTLTAGALAGCHKSSSEATAESTDTAALPGAIDEAHDGVTITWQVTPAGAVKARVKSASGEPLDKGVDASMTWKMPAGDTRVPLGFEPKSGLLTGNGPALAAELTEMTYTVTAGGKTYTGALHVPAGGTEALVESGKKAAQKPIPPGKTGPNGGVVQVVGDDVVEVVADKTSGQVRVYILGPDFKPIPIGNRKVKLGFVGGSTEIVVLSPGPDGLYFTGKLSAKADPVKLTIAVTIVDKTEVVLCGWSPGAVVVVGSAAPAIKVLVAVNWTTVDVKVKAPGAPGVIVVHDDDDDDDDHHHHKHKHKHKGHGRGHGH